MDWTQVLTILVTLSGLMFWFRSEARKDWERAEKETHDLRKEFNDINNELRREFYELNTSLRKDMMVIFSSIEIEMKDFHGRMSRLEERYIVFKMGEKQG